MGNPGRQDVQRLATQIDGRYLEKALEAIGWQQKQFAEHVEYSEFTVNRWCRLRAPMPKIVRLYLPCLVRLHGVQV